MDSNRSPRRLPRLLPASKQTSFKRREASQGKKKSRKKKRRSKALREKPNPGSPICRPPRHRSETSRDDADRQGEHRRSGSREPRRCARHATSSMRPPPPFAFVRSPAGSRPRCVGVSARLTRLDSLPCRLSTGELRAVLRTLWSGVAKGLIKGPREASAVHRVPCHVDATHAFITGHGLRENASHDALCPCPLYTPVVAAREPARSVQILNEADTFSREADRFFVPMPSATTPLLALIT